MHNNNNHQHFTCYADLDILADCIWWIGLAPVFASVCFSGGIHAHDHNQVGARWRDIDQRNRALAVGNRNDIWSEANK